MIPDKTATGRKSPALPHSSGVNPDGTGTGREEMRCGADSGFSELARQKRALRKQLLAARAAVLPEKKREWDAALCARFLALPEVQRAGAVYCYLSYGSEIDTRTLLSELRSRGVRTACPRVSENGKDMEFFWIGGPEDCAAGFHGILEPGSGCAPAKEPEALLLLPGLAFTRNGERLGYGGGFYDRFLMREPEHQTAALAYPFQLLDALPAEAHDRRAAVVLTPGETICCR